MKDELPEQGSRIRAKIVVPVASISVLLTYAAIHLRSYFSVSFPMNQDVLATLSVLLKSHGELRWTQSFDFTSGLGVADSWFPSVMDPLALLLHLAPADELFFWYRLSSVGFFVLLTLVITRYIAGCFAAPIACIGVVAMNLLPSRFFNLINVDFGGPGFVMMTVGWLLQLVYVMHILSARRHPGHFVGLALLVMVTMNSSHVWQVMYLYLAAFSFAALLIGAVRLEELMIQRSQLIAVISAWLCGLGVYIFAFGSYLPLVIFSARRTSTAVDSSREFHFVDLVSNFAGRGAATPIVVALSIIGFFANIRSSRVIVRWFLRFWFTWGFFIVGYSLVYPVFRSQGVEIANSPDYFMQASAPLHWVTASLGCVTIINWLTRQVHLLRKITPVSPVMFSVLLLISWGARNPETRAEGVWPPIARPARVFGDLSSSFSGYQIPDDARVLVIQDSASELWSFDEVFRDFSDLRRTRSQALINVYSGFVRPWSAEFVSSFLFDGRLRTSSITATKASPLALRLLGVDYVVTRLLPQSIDAERVAVRPDGLSLFRVSSAPLTKTVTYETRSNLRDHLELLKAADVMLSVNPSRVVPTVVYESLPTFGAPISLKMWIDRDHIRISGHSQRHVIVSLPTEFSMCNRWTTLTGDVPRAVQVNGFFQGYVAIGEFSGDIRRTTGGVGQMICETRDHMYWRALSASE